MKNKKIKVSIIATLLFSFSIFANAEYLNHQDMTLLRTNLDKYGEEHFVGQTKDQALANMIDANSSDVYELPNQVQTSGIPRLEMSYRFDQPTDISAFHFWNSPDPHNAVEYIELLLYTEASLEQGWSIIYDFYPSIASVGETTGGVYAQSFHMNTKDIVEVWVSLDNHSDGISFQNFGFSSPTSPVPEAGTLAMYVAGLTLIGSFIKRRKGERTRAKF